MQASKPRKQIYIVGALSVLIATPICETHATNIAVKNGCRAFILPAEEDPIIFAAMKEVNINPYSIASVVLTASLKARAQLNTKIYTEDSKRDSVRHTNNNVLSLKIYVTLPREITPSARGSRARLDTGKTSKTTRPDSVRDMEAISNGVVKPHINQC